ncbi:heat shock 70 kDa protein-like [Cynara cardunculus var. scolymus]|uniref:heat shock 70 kDa protein-like n=1 Tax=Cynara cardunculus var. scolymus TaxID=59895 RepID=UPI000D628D8C|nr:heat shock 70 kDa protein-like [Cynara cardunculus var. scolymus]
MVVRFWNKAIKITDGGGLSKAEIAKTIKDAERCKQEEEAHIEKAMAHKALNDYAFRLRVNLNRYKIRLSLIMDMGLSVKDLEEIEYEIKETIEWLDGNPDADIDELEEKEMELDNICRRTKYKLS